MLKTACPECDADMTYATVPALVIENGHRVLGPWECTDCSWVGRLRKLTVDVSSPYHQMPTALGDARAAKFLKSLSRGQLNALKEQLAGGTIDSH